jgi:hypothetical protein
VLGEQLARAVHRRDGEAAEHAFGDAAQEAGIELEVRRAHMMRAAGGDALYAQPERLGEGRLAGDSEQDVGDVVPAGIVEHDLVDDRHRVLMEGDADMSRDITSDGETGTGHYRNTPAPQP